MRRKCALAVLALVAGALFSSGCGDGPPFAVGGIPPPPEPSTACPFGVRGARVSMTSTEDGISIVLRAYGDVREVQRRAHDAASMYGAGAHRGLGHDGAHGGGEHHGLGLARLGVPVEAESRSTSEGAVILVRPREPGDRDRLQAAMWRRESDMRAGACH